MNALKIYVLMAVCIFGSLIGCDDGMVKAIPGHSVVKGKVTLNAEPLKSGVIRFHSTEEATKEKFTSAAITDGQYIMQATLGQNRVTISARGTSPDGSKFIELIPENYNSKSTLEANVQAENDDLDFPISSSETAE